MNKNNDNSLESAQSRERRQFYRVSDSIGLEYKLLDDMPEHPDEDASPFAQSSRFRLLNELSRIDQESAILLRHISDEDRNLARYLTSQNKKIDTIAKLLVSDEVSTTPYTVRNVSLSEGGCSFINEEKLEDHQPLALKLFFFSTYLGMVLYGHVVDSKPVDDEVGELFHTNVEFTDLDVADRQMLARYIIRRQAEQRRTAGESDD